jgi:hypothetical protein
MKITALNRGLLKCINENWNFQPIAIHLQISKQRKHETKEIQSMRQQ